MDLHLSVFSNQNLDHHHPIPLTAFLYLCLRELTSAPKGYLPKGLFTRFDNFGHGRGRGRGRGCGGRSAAAAAAAQDRP